MSHQKSILVIGYGNTARLDDGLGPRLIEIIRNQIAPEVNLATSMMINVEYAEQISEHDKVIFVDADISCEQPFYFKPVVSKTSSQGSSHHMTPEVIMGIAQTLFKAQTTGHVLGIRGYKFDGFGEEISPQAQDNLNQAAKFLIQRLHNQNFSAFP